MSDDHFEELRLIDHSRAQRIALLRWIPIMETAHIPDKEIVAICTDLSEDLRKAIEAKDGKREAA